MYVYKRGSQAFAHDNAVGEAEVELLSILELLKLRGFDASQPGKLVRHKSAEYDVQDLLRRGWLDTYQQYQQKPVFGNSKHIVSFLGLEGTKARFVGVYRVGRKLDGIDVPSLPSGCPYTEWESSQVYYELEKEDGYEDLENRVVIDWGRGAMAWCQNLRDKEVVELLPSAHARPIFKDYMEFTLTHDELQDLFNNEDANREWRSQLSAVGGIYLIVATRTGEQYVGSASGAEGIWGRWENYANTGHGGNEALIKMMEDDAAYPKAFSYSILQILPKTTALVEVLNWESRYKEKLGSKATGLNRN